MKICIKCNEEKSFECFSVDKKNKHNGRTNVCKVCFREYRKPKPPKPRNPQLLQFPAPDLDKVLHCVAVKASDELSALTMKEDMSYADVTKMKGLMDIILVYRKKARPLNNEEDVTDPTEDLFA